MDCALYPCVALVVTEDDFVQDVALAELGYPDALLRGGTVRSDRRELFVRTIAFVEGELDPEGTRWALALSQRLWDRSRFALDELADPIDAPPVPEPQPTSVTVGPPSDVRQ